MSSNSTVTTASEVLSDSTISKVQAEAPSESTSPPSPPEESSSSDDQSSQPPPPDSSSESKKESSSSSSSDDQSSPPPPAEDDDKSSPPPPAKEHQSSPPPPPPEKSSSTTQPPPTTETNTPPAPVAPNHHPPPPPPPPVSAVPVVGGHAPPVVPPNVVLAPPQIPVTPAGQSNLTSAGPPGPGSPSPSNSSPSSTATHNHQQIQHLVIAGAVAGTVFFLILVLICALCCKLKKGRKKHDLQDPYWQYTYAAGGKDQHTVNIPPQSMTGGGGGGAYGWSTPTTTPVGATVYMSSGVNMVPPPPPPPNGMSTSSSEMMTSSGGSAMTGSSPGGLGYLSKSAFTYDELAAATNGFSQTNMLGQGGFGFVHKGVLPNGKEVAIKSLKSGSGQGEREFQSEVEIISRVHHRHLVSLVGYCIAGSKRMLVYEFVPNDTLEHHLHKKAGPPLSFSMRVRIALGSAKGLAYLHEDCHPRIIHRDIKASNILLDGTFEAQVADFGLAKLTEDTNTHVSTRVMGTFGYLAPEYAASGKLTEKSDVFSFGVMLLELITGRRPVDPDMKYMEDSLVDWARPLLSKAVDDGNYDDLADPKLVGNYNHQEMAHMVACAAACIRHSARKRPKMSQVVRALEGDMALDDLNEMAVKKQVADSSSGTGSDDVYDTRAYSADLKKFRQMAFGSLEFTGVQSSTGSSSNYK